MDSSTDISQLCRLCLLKDKVNTPIFEGQGDIGHVYKKISSLLPVKVAEDDKLPKSICDSCTLKLDMFYEFWQMSGQSEKKLLEWLNETEPNNINQPTETIVKQEAIDINDKLEVFMNVPTYGQDFFEETTTTVDEPQAKRPKRATAAKAAATLHETDDEDDPSETLTKMEDESEGTEGEDQESAIVNVPSTSADSQPGPSGVGKESSEAPVILRLVNEADVEEEIILDIVTNEPREKDNPKRLQTRLCNVCGKSMLSKHLKSHMKKHNIFQCEECLKELKSAEELAEHELVHRSNNYTCHLCSLAFEKVVELSMHSVVHLDYFSCPICTFTTKIKHSMVNHVRRHEGDLPFVCEVCQKGFLCKASLDSHEEIHADIRKYKCDFCYKSFAVKRYLEVHKRLNHKKEILGHEELFECEHCKKQFTFEKSLKRHLSTIHKIGEDKTVECPICYKLIANNYNLKMHMRVHTGEKKYVCEDCGKAFAEHKYWKKHRAMHEKENMKFVKIEST